MQFVRGCGVKGGTRVLALVRATVDKGAADLVQRVSVRGLRSGRRHLGRKYSVQNFLS